MDQPVDVVAMGVGEHDLGDIVEPQTCRRHRGWELLLARDLHPRERHVSRRRGLARVDESQHALVLDRPAVNRQRV